MANCNDCRFGYWEETFEDAYFVCEKCIYDEENCKEFEKLKESDNFINYDFLNQNKDYICDCSCQSLQGFEILFRNIKDLKCGDTFVITEIHRNSTSDVPTVKLQKIYKYGENND